MAEHLPPSDTPRKEADMPRKHLSGVDRRDQMVEQAIELFAQKGFALTTRELARELHITQPLLYRYFPSKQELIEQVYERVFLSRWNPLWEVWLADRSRPFRDRLVQYFVDYTQAILTSEWVRIFLYAGLQDPSLNQRYLQMLHERIFRILSQELHYDLGREQALTSDQAMLENEAWWGLHSSFFYMGVRKWVYQLEVPDELDAVIAYRVDAFLDGLR
ncbi:TetR/AcrR family transcriptional regulator [Alcaligenes sp. NLF5-7]|uniref:TetR/AcrR family transcriptional regulator n=2 Tax=Alcaligenes TaxID=507 RepID=UPI0010080DAD|nr:TetR/AcrR family transcriptional regulator [Alcaligenes sp. NLF5-7]UTM00121.1 TetR/AcrR family transcriptional regulator [Alcaligenes sp. NLF5-7]